MARNVPPRTSADAADQQILLRDERVWNLYVAGSSAREIGGIVGISHTHVLRIIHSHQGDSPRWSIPQVALVEDERLERLLSALRPAIDEGDLAAISEARKISESRRKLFGADGPVTVNVNTAEVSAIDAAYQDLVAEMNAANAAREAKLRDTRGV